MRVAITVDFIPSAAAPAGGPPTEAFTPVSYSEITDQPYTLADPGTPPVGAILVRAITGKRDRIPVVDPAWTLATSVLGGTAGTGNANTSEIHLFWHHFTGVMPSLTATPTGFTRTRPITDVLMGFTGLNTTTPFEATSTLETTATAEPHVVPGVTTLGADRIVMLITSTRPHIHAITPPAGSAPRIDPYQDHPLNAFLIMDTWISTFDVAAAGPTGDFSVAISKNSTTFDRQKFHGAAILVALNPA